MDRPLNLSSGVGGLIFSLPLLTEVASLGSGGKGEGTSLLAACCLFWPLAAPNVGDLGIGSKLCATSLGVFSHSPP